MSLNVQHLLTDHIDLWTSAIENKSNAGRGSRRKQTLYGIKKLRELILELAVRGKLVPQDPNDEPASQLLKRIEAERDQLVKEGKIKKPKKLPEISDEEKPFELPEGWEWARLNDVIQISSGDGLTSSQMNKEGEIPVFGGNGITGFHDIHNISEATLVIGRVGFYCGSVHITPDCAWVTDNAFITHFSCENLSLSFLYWLLKGTNLREDDSATAQPVISGRKVYPIVTAIPPLPEQHRIVAKVDELMALCDQLEQQTEQQLDAHQQLVDTLLDTLTQSQNADELADNWTRLSEHFDTLFTTEASIDQLKQTILQLAVMGKLVPQNPNDEPASELLKRIATEKAQLIKDRKIKKQKPLPPISEEEKPFELPEGWEWIKFGLLAEFINGDRGKNYPNKNEYTTSGLPWINTGHIEPDGTLSTASMNFITPEKFESLRSGKIVPNDLVYCLRGATFGKTAFVTPYTTGAIASSLMIIRPHIPELKRFVYRYLTSPFGRTQIFRFDNGSAQPNLSANSVMLYAFPCPPLSEQNAIELKINELFTLCDQLKERLAHGQQTQLQLTDTLVTEALNG